MVRMFCILFFHLSTDEHWGYFYCMTIIKNAALRNDTQISVEVSALSSVVRIPRSTIAELNGNSTFIYLSTIHPFFQWLYHFTLLSAMHRIKISLQLLFFVFITANLMSVKWYLIIDFICISLMISNAEHIPVGRYMSSSKKCL